MTTLWARCVRGLEPVVSAEVTEDGFGQVVETAHRTVVFDAADAAADAVGLRTVDDVYALRGDVRGIVRERGSLARLAAAVFDIDIDIDGSGASGIEVTASFLGKRNYNRFEIEDAVGAALAERLGVAYFTRAGGDRPPAGASGWRVHVEDDRALIGRRLAATPLHRRAYKSVAPPGTLHPPVAAAMARLTAPVAGHLVVDPTCGAGTLIAEAAAHEAGILAIGGDVDAAMARAAMTNGATAWCGDAGALPLADASVDVVVANLPWGRQTPLAGPVDRVLAEIGRVLRPGGRVALLSEADLDASAAGLAVVRRLPLSLMGSHPAISVLA